MVDVPSASAYIQSMGIELRSAIRLPIECAICGNYTEQTIAWLINNNTLTCRHCRNTIDLNVKKTRAMIKRFDDACLRFPGLSEKTS